MLNINKKTVIYIFVLIIGFVLYVCNGSFANPEIKIESQELNKKSEDIKVNLNQTPKNNKLKDNPISITWTETLSLQDFFISPDYLEAMSRLKEYKTALTKEYSQTPSVFSTAINYGLLLIDLGELEKARLIWGKAAKDFYANETPKAYKAWVSARLGNYQEAKDIWYPIAKEKEGLGIVGLGARIWLPYHTDSILGLYLIKDYLPEEQREEVAKVVNSIVGAIPDNPRFAAVLVNEYLKSGQLEKAAGVLSSVLKNNPDDPVLITLLGITQIMTNHYDEGLKLFERAKEINPNILTNRIMRARALFALNREKESFQELDEAIKLNPDLNIAENKKKKFLATKSYIISKKIKNEPKEEKNLKESEKTKEPQDLNKAFVPQN